MTTAPTTNDRLVVLSTVHGSHLYGLAHPGSDLDHYVVLANNSRRARQTIKDGDDTVVLTLAEFVRQVHKGVPQSLEALFSPIADVRALDGYRDKFYPHTASVVNVYARTMKSFALFGDIKRRRHALRLAMNLADMVRTGRFNPRLSAQQAADLTGAAQGEPQEFLRALRTLSPVDVGAGDETFAERLAVSYELGSAPIRAA